VVLFPPAVPKLWQKSVKYLSNLSYHIYSCIPCCTTVPQNSKKILARGKNKGSKNLSLPE
jgi:hypothetical protein